MNKRMTRVFLAGILALFVATAVLVPTMTSVYAATAPAATAPSTPPAVTDQMPAPQPPANEPPKDGADPHSGHH